MIRRLFAAFIFFCLGSGLTIWGVKSFLAARNSTNWPTVMGVVKSSNLARKDGHGSGYRADILYEYTVNGVLYSSDEVFYQGSSTYGRASEARKTLNRYPAGRQVVVHYRPENPEIAVLEPGVKPVQYALMGGGLSFLIIGPIVSLFGRSRWR